MSKNQITLPKWAVLVAIIGVVGMSLLGAIFSLYYSRVAKTAASTRTAMSTDQVLASLSTNITVLGGIIAIATIVIGLAALYGYAELRTATVRKTEEDLVSIIESLTESGDLTEATAGVLREAVASSRPVDTSEKRTRQRTDQAPLALEKSESHASKVVQNGDQLADDYPESDHP